MLFRSAAFAWSQATASLSGVVKDPSGAVVSAASVTLTDSQTSAKRTTVTDGAGKYTFAGVAAGDYTIDVSAPGFSEFGAKISVNAQPATRDVALALASQAGQVSVEAKIDPFNVVPIRPTQSLYGLDKSIEDIPRSISTADAETLTRYSVKTVNDLVRSR